MRASRQRFQFRKEPQQRRVPQELKPHGRAFALEQQLAELLEHAFGRNLPQVQPPTQFHQRRIRAHVEARAELRHAQAAQRILGKGVCIHRAEQPALKIPTATVGIQDFSRQNIETHAVDGEIPATRRGLEVEVRVAPDLETTMPWRDLAVAPGQRKVRIEFLQAQHAESPTHRQHAAVSLKQVSQRVQINPVDLYIEILRRLVAQHVPHVAADDERAAVSLRNLPGDVPDAGVDHAVHHTRVSGKRQWAGRPTAGNVVATGGLEPPTPRL